MSIVLLEGKLQFYLKRWTHIFQVLSQIFFFDKEIDFFSEMYSSSHEWQSVGLYISIHENRRYFRILSFSIEKIEKIFYFQINIFYSFISFYLQS